MRNIRRLPWVMLALAILGACDGDPAGPVDDEAVFVLEVSGEEFTARVTDPDEIAALEARMEAGTEGVVLGELLAGDGGFNSPWSWHWDPSTVHVADVATEVCDGRPSMVEADLDYWLNTVERFCPWGATVVERVD